MLRRRHLRKAGGLGSWRVLPIYQLDQGSVAVSLELGVKMFNWGPRLEGFQE